jgi:prepilin-type N-terminal cleavage/methylation domain-containing protein
MHRRAFTLIELLVTIGVVAILSIVVVLVVNPAEILRQSRDSVRLNDVKTIDGMVSAYQQAVGGSLGTPGVTYVSIPDPTATSSAGTDCTGDGAPFTGGGAFHCAATSNLRKVDGTGWIPVNLAAAPDGLSIGALPIDPVNTTSSNQYYLYQTDGTTYEIKALPESQTYTAATSTAPFTRGTNLTLIFGTYLSQFGSYGRGNGQFRGAGPIAINASGNVYVVDGNNRVDEFSSNGTYISKFASHGTGAGQLANGGAGIAIDADGNVYVSDQQSVRVEKFDSSGNFITMWGWGVQDGASQAETCTSGCQAGIVGAGDGQFGGNAGIAIDASGDVYVTDISDSRVQKFSSNGTYISQFGSVGTGNGQFESPEDIAIDTAGNIYVTDSGGEYSRVEKFDSNGTYLSQFAPEDGGLPNGIAIDTAGNIYVTTTSCHVEKFSSDGTYIAELGSCGTGDGNGQFVSAVNFDVAVAPNGNLYASDFSDSRVEIFSLGN